MHEMALAQGILETVCQAAGDGDEKILRIKLVLGEMSGVVPESLEFCFEAVAAGTRAEGAVLDMEIRPLRAFCRDCGQEFAVEKYTFLCPECGSAALKLISGRELAVDYLEVDECK